MTHNRISSHLLESTARAQEDARALAGSLGELAGGVHEQLANQAAQRPYWILGAAAAAGFALGGGLPRRWGRFAAGLAVRAALGVAVNAFAEQLSGSHPGGDTP